MPTYVYLSLLMSTQVYFWILMISYVYVCILISHFSFKPLVSKKWTIFLWNLEIYTIEMKLLWIGLHFLCSVLGVVSINTWLISNREENDCCYKLINWQNDNFDHFEWNICHIVHLHNFYQHSISSQLEISLVLNETIPIIQHRKWGHIKQEFAEKTKTAAKKQ